MTDDAARRREARHVAALVTLGCGLLPMWDAFAQYSMLSALAGSGLGSSSAVPLPPGVVGAPAIAIAVGFATYHLAKRTAGGAAALLSVVSIGTMAYALSTGADTACRRSHAVDGWSLCETPGTSPQGYGVHLWSSRHAPDFEGPHLDNGDPCVSVAEERDVHARAYPDGDVSDGLAQIWKRFPKDFSRVVSGTLLVAAALGGAAALLHGAARRRARDARA